METTLSDKIPKLEDANTVQVNGDNLAESMVIQDKPKEVITSVKTTIKTDAKDIANPKTTTLNTTTAKPMTTLAKTTPPMTGIPKTFTKPADVALASQIAQPANSPPAFPLSQPFDSSPAAPPIAHAISASESSTVKCSCGVNKQALEMLQCIQCDNWQHTVCVGFISRKDRRLELRDPDNAPPYACYNCKYGKQPHTFAFLKRLSLFRKGVMTLSAEGYDTLTRFANLMEVGKQKAADIRNELFKEGFLLDRGNYKFVARSPDEFMKQRVKYFFHQNLTIFPEFVEAQRKDGIECAGSKNVSNIIENVKPIVNNYTDPQPKMTKKRAASASVIASQSAFSEDFMSQTPVINRVSGTGIATPPESSKKKFKMSIPNENISYE